MILAIIFFFLLTIVVLILLTVNIKLRQTINLLKDENAELYSKINTFIRVRNRLKEELKEKNNVIGNSIDYDTKKFFGKKVIVGNHMKSGALHTQKVLQSLGFNVEIVLDPQDIIDNIVVGEKYDAIITNSLYNHGETGEKLLHTLKGFENFKTPIIVHTIDKNKEFYYVNQIGFDGYLEKPLDEKSVIKVMEHLLK